MCPSGKTRARRVHAYINSFSPRGPAAQLKEMQLDHHRFHSYKHTTRGAVVVLLIVFINIYIYKYLYNTAKVKKLKTLFTRGEEEEDDPCTHIHTQTAQEI